MPGNKKVSAPKKKVSKKSAPKTTTPKTPTPAPKVETTTVVDTPAENTVENYGTEFTFLLGQLKTLQNTLKELTTYTAKLEKRVARDQKAVQEAC